MIPLNTVRPWNYSIGNGRHYRRRRVPCWSWPTIETDEDVQKAVAQIKANTARRTPQINAQDALEDLIKAELEKSDEDFDLAELVRLMGQWRYYVMLSKWHSAARPNSLSRRKLDRQLRFLVCTFQAVEVTPENMHELHSCLPLTDDERAVIKVQRQQFRSRIETGLLALWQLTVERQKSVGNRLG